VSTCDHEDGNRTDDLAGAVARDKSRDQIHRYRYTEAMASETYSRHLIRIARRQAGLTQQALADRAGTSQAAVSAYESGRRSPSVDTLCRLLGAAGYEVRMRLAPPADQRTGSTPSANSFR
jgi:DNA-binding transcriptional regulator YiaG